MNAPSVRLLSQATLLVALVTAGCTPPTTVGFESVAVADAGYLDASQTAPAVVVDGVSFASSYNTMYKTSSGTTISTLKDKTTAGYMNAYSAFPGGGAAGSAKFAVLYPFDPMSPIISFSKDVVLKSVAVANTTYAALSMQTGDQFAKKFTTDGKDFFDVVFKGVDATGKTTGTVKFYLGDFRTASSPGIATGWTTVDLSALGLVRKLDVSFESSDVGTYGINTPTYVAIDDLTYFE